MNAEHKIISHATHDRLARISFKLFRQIWVIERHGVIKVVIAAQVGDHLICIISGDETGTY